MIPDPPSHQPTARLRKVSSKLQFAKFLGQTEQYFFQSNETRKLKINNIDIPYSIVLLVVVALF